MCYDLAMKTICLRTDGNEKIATGHIQRCLSIARAFNAVTSSIISQINVIFIVSDKKSKHILEERFECDNEFSIEVLGCDYSRAEETLPALVDCLGHLAPDALIIDSYFVNEEYLVSLHQYTAAEGIKLAYIDDLCALNKYDVDVIINYSTVSIPQSYMSVPVKLCGKKYTPLREQFSQNSCIIKDTVKDIFISTGGTDPFGMCLKLCNILDGYDLHILTGKMNPDYTALKELSNKKSSIHVYESVSDVASLMAKCDIGICAGGTTLGELCAVGTPSVSFIIAENQRIGVSEFANDGIIPCAGDCMLDTDKVLDRISAFVSSMSIKDSKTRDSISQKMRRYIDGTGAYKIAETIL